MKRRGLAFALLAVACGGQVEREAAPSCHEVRGYFADQRCLQRATFDSCNMPARYFGVRDFKCTQINR